MTANGRPEYVVTKTALLTCQERYENDETYEESKYYPPKDKNEKR